MRFFQPHDYVASITLPTERRSVVWRRRVPVARAGVQIKNLDVMRWSLWRAEILAFLEAARDGQPSPVSGVMEGMHSPCFARIAANRRTCCKGSGCLCGRRAGQARLPDHETSTNRLYFLEAVRSMISGQL